ncbi:MAG: hypothetical protein ACRELB_12760 [Polyangiaceae bacterium]
MNRSVKGTLFVDYVRMLRGHKDADWSKHLLPEDMSYLVQRVQPGEWYPMASFERMGLAILTEIAHGELETVRSFGRVSIDWLCQQHPTLLAQGDPRDTIMRFQVLRQSFFDYPALEIVAVSDGEATLNVGYGMGDRAEEAASWQTLGFFERLLEVADATEVHAWFSGRSWVGDPKTVIQLRWGGAAPAGHL